MLVEARRYGDDAATSAELALLFALGRRALGEQIRQLNRYRVRDAEKRCEGGVRPAGLDSPDMRRFDTVSLRGLFDGPTARLAKLAQSRPELSDSTAKGGRFTVVSRFRDAAPSRRQGLKTVPLAFAGRDL